MDVTGVIGMAWSYGLQSMASSYEKNQWQGLEEQIVNLSEKQQRELEAKLLSTEDELERSRILFQYLAVQKNQALIEETKAERNKGLMVIGIGAIMLIGVVLLARKKNG